VAESYEHCNEPLGSVRGEEFPGDTSDYLLRKNGSGPWTQPVATYALKTHF
jgi:hypothetical protein